MLQRIFTFIIFVLMFPNLTTHADTSPKFEQLDVITPDNVRFIEDLWTIPIDGTVQDIVWSPDDRLLAVAANNDILLFDALDWAQLPSMLKGHQSLIWDIAFSPDGKSLVSGGVALGGDNTARIWDIDKSYARVTIAQLPDEFAVENVSFFNNGKEIITVSSDFNALRFWDSRTGKFLRSYAIEPPDSWVRISSHSFSENGTLFGIGTIQNRFSLWKLTPQPEPINLPAYFHYGVELAFSNDSRYMAIADRYCCEGLIFDFVTNLGSPISAKYDIVRAQTFDPTAKLLIQSTWSDANPEPVIRIWNTSQHEQIVLINPTGRANIERVAFSHNGKLLLTLTTEWDADKKVNRDELHLWGVHAR
jgi:WD40 repeat protein